MERRDAQEREGDNSGLKEKRNVLQVQVKGREGVIRIVFRFLHRLSSRRHHIHHFRQQLERRSISSYRRVSCYVCGETRPKTVYDSARIAHQLLSWGVDWAGSKVDKDFRAWLLCCFSGQSGEPGDRDEEGKRGVTSEEEVELTAEVQD